MFRPLRYILERTVTTGLLRLVDAGGRAYAFGDHSGTPVVARINDRRTEWRLALNPVLAVGEAYMDGRLVIEQGTIYDFLELLLANVARGRWPRWLHLMDCLRFVSRRLQHYNPVRRAKRNVAHHYDLDGSLYDLFLDRDRQYSCAYFEQEGTSLDAAQEAKKRHLAAKLNLKDGLRVLDIGSGWGGLALYLAKTAHVEVTGITLSEEQLKIAQERARAEGLSKAVKFELCDYRQLDGRFDRIVSVGMFEHVGTAHYRSFFQQVSKLLADDGVALIHSIGRFDGPAATNPFIAKYIFPGGYIPALSEVLPAVEREGLLATDLEILRLHYAMTLRHWRQRFRGSWHTAAERFGERFCRMWEMYLAGSETAFRYQNLMVFQLQLTKDQSALPLTRDYMHDNERELRARDGQQARTQKHRTGR
ncbi:MAG: class I SAM-dependent methyltransferase [Methyloceanibacter sp.]|uniref:class I SAM-dependent methyltransferase n=1 Tax=Methyloceanibacter sp. TaxID=1965321 RepID=UPI003D6D2037